MVASVWTRIAAVRDRVPSSSTELAIALFACALALPCYGVSLGANGLGQALIYRTTRCASHLALRARTTHSSRW